MVSLCLMYYILRYRYILWQKLLHFVVQHNFLLSHWHLLTRSLPWASPSTLYMEYPSQMTNKARRKALGATVATLFQRRSKSPEHSQCRLQYISLCAKRSGDTGRTRTSKCHRMPGRLSRRALQESTTQYPLFPVS